jgi:hypothetical protein
MLANELSTPEEIFPMEEFVPVKVNISDSPVEESSPKITKHSEVLKIESNLQSDKPKQQKPLSIVNTPKDKFPSTEITFRKKETKSHMFILMCLLAGAVLFPVFAIFLLYKQCDKNRAKVPKNPSLILSNLSSIKEKE